MKKKSFLSFISVVMSVTVLLSSLALSYMLPISAADDVSTIVEATTDLPEIIDESASAYANGPYGYETLDMYTASEAADAGVPEGYSDNVWKLTTLASQGTNGETGVVIDFTAWGINVDQVKSMTIRYYVDSDCKAIRLANNNQWILNTTDIANEQWAEVTLTSGFGSFVNNADGTLGKVALCFRYGYTFYVDSITFTLTETQTMTTTDIPKIIGESAAAYAGGSYDYTTLDIYTAAEAATAGVPEGYSDNVLKMTDATSGETGVVLDFTSWGIKVEDIESMTIRFYTDADCKDIRLGNEKSWKSLGNEPATETWTTLTVTQSACKGFANNADGTLGKVALCFRYGCTFYVDSITFDLKEQADVGGDDKDYLKKTVARKEIPYATDGRPAFDKYSYEDLAIYTAEEAAAAGVPEGYTGYVMMLKGKSEVGISMDLTDRNIPLGLVKSMTFRVYVPEGIAEVRLADLSGNWLVRHTPAQVDSWIDITLYPDGKGFNGGNNFTNILNEDQTLGAFDFCLRYPNGTKGTAYLDGFTFELKENDGVAPVIQYKGSTTIATSADKPFVLQDLMAYDEQEGRNIAPVLTWSEGALNENGLLQKGNHTCVATFTDAYGNKSEITLTLNVGDRDTEAPVIQFGLTTINATAGTRVDLAKTIVVTDNYDVVAPVLTWSDGAVDAYNRLQAGMHTLTITATDLTGLQSEKTVTFNVADTADAPATPTPVN